MKISLLKRIALYTTILIGLAISATQLDFPKATADEGTICCTFGNECPSGHAVCCRPGFDMAPCSQNKPNYCLAACPTN